MTLPALRIGLDDVDRRLRTCPTLWTCHVNSINVKSVYVNLRKQMPVTQWAAFKPVTHVIAAK